MRPFGCLVTILNTLDSLGNFEGKVDEGFLVGYSVNSKAFRVFNSRTRIVQETLHVNFLENKPNIAGSGPTWLFDIDSLTSTMNYQPVTVGNQTNPSIGFQDKFDAKKVGEEIDQQYMLFPVWSSGFINPQNNDGDAAFDGKEHYFDAKKPESKVNVSPSSSAQSRKQDDKTKKEAKEKSLVKSFTGYRDLSIEFEDCSDNSIKEEELLQFKMQKVWVLVNLPHGKRAIGTKWVYKNKKDEKGIMVRNKARLVAQGQTQEEGIDYEEVFARIERIKVIRLFLAYVSFMGFMLYQMDVKSAFLYGTIKEEIYVCQPLGFEDPDHPDKVYKVVKTLYGLHRAPRAWYETLANYLLENGFQRAVERQVLDEFNERTHILYGSSEKPLLKDPDGEDVDIHTYRSMIGSLMYLTSSRPDIMFAVNDITRLQALVDRKKVVITKATIRDALCLDDAEGVDCLPNEEIFTELARIGYEKPSTKLTFYKAFFSSQWKFLIHTILRCMSAKRTSWNEFSSSMASAVICLSTGKGFSGVETTLFKGMLVERQGDAEGDADKYVEEVNTGDVAKGDDSAAHGEVQQTPPQSPQVQPPSPQPQPQPQQAADFPMSLLQKALDAYVALTRRVEHLEYDRVAQEITKLKRRVKKLKKRNKVRLLKLRRLQRVGTSQRVDTSDDTMMDDESNQERMIAEIDKDDVVVLMDGKEEDKKVEEAKDETKPAEVQEVVDVVTTAKLITEVVTAASETVTAANTIIPTAKTQVPAATLTAAPIRVIAAPSRRRKGVIIRDPEEESATSTIIPAKTKSKDKVRLLQGNVLCDIRLIFEAKFNSNVYFLLKLKEQMEEEENRALQTINATPTKKATKRKKLNEEVEELKRHLQIVPNEDDDIYTEATLLARKVHVVDYEIIEINNKPYYKIIRADGTHQLYISFLTLLRNFDREDLEALWSLVVRNKQEPDQIETKPDQIKKKWEARKGPKVSKTNHSQDSRKEKKYKIYSNPLFDEEIIPIKIDQHPFNAESDLIESMPNHDSSIIISSKTDSIFDEFAGELTLLKSIPPGIDETDCHPEKKVRLAKRLLYDNSSPHPPEEIISDNSNADIESFSPSPIPNEDSDSHIEEINLPFTPDDPMPPSIEDDDYDSGRDILILAELLDNYSLSLPDNESYHFDIPSPYRPPAKPPNGNIRTLNIKMMGDVSDQKVPIPGFTITRVSNQEKSPAFLSHQGLEFIQPSAECPMIINGKNTPILDVPLFHFYPP
nr:ribonuclease H-like domain-containing protein [Tanacetum cinerariifolium]